MRFFISYSFYRAIAIGKLEPEKNKRLAAYKLLGMYEAIQAYIHAAIEVLCFLLYLIEVT
ncbi:hypothetical protein CUU66_18210 [Peribacillus deserti]|uniref:Uncharacterized protein n=1 Tax=Peribacillus deserti TaxID=673318 RepID=A0A2N5M2G9_9BACI|nr:hypothetical protein CUU66_18210 [Peribacillus deserti]